MLFRCALVTYTTGVGGDVAQLGERRTRIAEVVGSNPIVSTKTDAGFVKLPLPRRFCLPSVCRTERVTLCPIIRPVGALCISGAQTSLGRVGQSLGGAPLRPRRATTLTCD